MTKPKFKEITIQVPAKYKWKATDENGTIFIFTHKPKIANGYWSIDMRKSGYYIMAVGESPIPKDFTKTLERI